MLKLSNEELILTTKRLAREERRIGLDVLEHLREIEQRRLHAERGFSSLFAFCTQELGYSEPQAQLRIDAMRALRDTPEIVADVQSGALHLTTLAKVRRFLRSERQKRGKDYSPEERRQLFKRLKGKSSREVDQELAAISPVAVRIDETVRFVSRDLTELKLVITEVLRGKLQALQDYYSHRMQNPNSYIEVIELLAADALKKHWSYPTKKLRIYQSK